MATINPVEMSFRLEFQDLWRVNYWSLSRRLHLNLVLPVAILPLICTPFALFAYQMPWTGIFGPMIFPGALLFLIFSQYLATRNVLRTHRALQQPIHYRFSADGIDTSAESSHGHTGWTNIYQVFENRHAFLIYLSINLLHVIPKRAFRDQEEISQFREMLRTCVGPKARLSRI